jgi:ACR3 family arsenite efflux pump ArsB
MDNLNDLKKIWLTADTTGLPNSAEMVRTVKKFRNKKLLKLTAIVFVALVLSALMVFVMFWLKSTMITTRIGEVLMLVSSLILLGTNLNSWNRFYKFNDFDNVDFIKFLEKTRRRQAFYYNKTQVIALTLVSAGLIIYLIEPSLKSLTIALSFYGFVVVYLVVIWLIVRPRAYKRQAKKMDDTIKRFELLIKQLDEPVDNDEV